MKKILSTFLLALCIIIAGCDNGADSLPDTLEIVKSDVNFGAVGGSGSVQLKATSQVKAVSGADWCQLTEVTENNVVFVVSANAGYSSRSTQIIMTSEGGKTQKVTVTQEGGVLYMESDGVLSFAMEGGTSKVNIGSNLPYRITSDADWLTCDVKDGVLTVTAAGSTTGRMANILVDAGGRTLTLTVSQISFESLVGTYTCSYTNFDGAPVSLDVRLSVLQDNYYILEGVYPDLGLSLLVQYQDGKLLLPMQFLGSVASMGWHLYLCPMNSVTTSFTWDPASSMRAVPSLINGQLAYAFKDNGTVAGSVIDAMIIAIFKAKPPTSASFYNGYDAFINPVMIKK